MSSCSSYSTDVSAEDELSESESQRHRRKKKEKKQARRKDKKRHKHEKKRHKKEKERKRARKERKRARKERKRRRSVSTSSSSSWSDSRSRDSYDGRGRGGSPPPMRRHIDAGRHHPSSRRDASAYRGHRDRSRSPAPAALAKHTTALRSPMKLPADGRKMTIAEACEAAGRGITTGQTALDHEVQVYGPDEEPVDATRYDSFDDAREFPREIREELKHAGFPGPSQIQAWTWPLGLRGKDIIGIAATGSGKTLAFLLPAFTQMHDEGIRPERDGPGLLVMSPTRELVQQTEQEATRFGRCLNFRCVAMYGGAPKGNQISKYRQGCHTIVACPGRLNDFLDAGQVRLDGVMKLVLDEADRMLDMGFEPQIRKILMKVPRRRHTLFFTATWPREVRKLAGEILSRPYKVMIGNRDQLKGNQDITQEVRIVEAFDKNNQIENLLREAGLMNRDSSAKCLVFCNTKRMCEQLSNMLARSGIMCTSIHGDKDQMQRDEALNGLKSGRFKILVATDVAARGLDIKGVGLVINYDPANNTEDYVHRIGRTARAGAKGFAVTFLTSVDGHKAAGMLEVMERTDQKVPQQLRDLASTGSGGKGFSRYRPSFGKGFGMAFGGGITGANTIPLGGALRDRSPRR